MLMSSGFTDDLFPADETIRYYNRTRTQYPDADLALFFGDFGHPRGAEQGRRHRRAGRLPRTPGWTSTSRASGAEPPQGVTAYTLDVPEHRSLGRPVHGVELGADGEGRDPVRVEAGEDDRARRRQHRVAAKFNPVGGGGACAHADGADQPGTATYRLDPAPAGGYTMMGSATVIAKFTLPGDTSQVAARLLDVAPDGRRRWSTRGLWRPATGGPDQAGLPAVSRTAGPFAEGHVPKLELLPADSNAGLAGGYGRASNGQQPVTVADLELRMPVVEKPGSFGGLVGAPAEKFLPKGYELAADFAALADRIPKLEAEVQAARARSWSGSSRARSAYAACNDEQGRRDREQVKAQEGGQGRQGQAQEGRRRQDQEAEAEATGKGRKCSGPEAEAASSRSSRPSSAEPVDRRRRRRSASERRGSAEVGAGGDRAGELGGQRLELAGPGRRAPRRGSGARPCGSSLLPADAAGGSSAEVGLGRRGGAAAAPPKLEQEEIASAKSSARTA